MTRPIRYGIVGFGGFAERAVAPAIKASPNSELVAIQKRSLAVSRSKGAEYNIPHAFDSVEQLVAHPDVDAVFIASANSEHCRETLIAAKAGKHVLVEKPMALTITEAEQMIRACDQANVKLMVGHMVRLSPLCVRMKEIVQSGLIGRVTFVRSEFIYDGRNSQRKWLQDQRVAGGGPVFDVGVHCLDTIRFILDDEVTSVKSQLEPFPTGTSTETTATLSLRLSKGVLASIYCSYASSIRRSTIEIIGTEGILFAKDFTRSDTTVALTISLGKADKEAETRTETFVVPNLYTDEVTRFSSCIINNTESPISGANGLQNQRVLDAAIRNG
jgi:1,5-anhydro-D-fructose reductase (1,5-anhydro-D-mannitol-forming)